ncbi:MAG: class I SAM-dependent methyltransferase, partial [Spirochaetales bacterium]|nr:class I SAM-dependent methyltransferase [Candidatus Physcosoma equi]
MSNPILLKGLLSFGVENAEEKAEKLQKYVEEILLFNPTLKLVGDKTEKDLIVRHILD